MWFLWSYSATRLKPEVQMMNGNVLAAGITNYVAYRRRPWLVIKIMPKRWEIVKSSSRRKNSVSNNIAVS